MSRKKEQGTEIMWHKVQLKQKKKRKKTKSEETHKADVSLGALDAFRGNVCLLWTRRGDTKKMHLCETPKSSWAVSKADERVNTWERREKDSLEKHKTGEHTTQNGEEITQTLQFVFVRWRIRAMMVQNHSETGEEERWFCELSCNVMRIKKLFHEEEILITS